MRTGVSKDRGMTLKGLCYTPHFHVFQFKGFPLPSTWLSIWGYESRRNQGPTLQTQWRVHTIPTRRDSKTA